MWHGGSVSLHSSDFHPATFHVGLAWAINSRFITLQYIQHTLQSHIIHARVWQTDNVSCKSDEYDFSGCVHNVFHRTSCFTNFHVEMASATHEVATADANQIMCSVYIYIYSTNRVKSNKLCRQTRAGSSSSFFFSWILQLKSIAGLLSWTRFTNSCNCSYHRLTWASIPYELLTMIESKCMQIANIPIYLSVQNGCFDRSFYFFFLRAQPQQQLPIHPKYLQIFLCRYFSILFHHSL